MQNGAKTVQRARGLDHKLTNLATIPLPAGDSDTKEPLKPNLATPSSAAGDSNTRGASLSTRTDNSDTSKKEQQRAVASLVDTHMHVSDPC